MKAMTKTKNALAIVPAILRIAVFAFLTALAPCSGYAAGSIPVALSQQVDSNGKPLVGALLYLYVVGTVSQPQLAYQDTGLSLPLPWPVVADANGRLPMFYLADGSVHARLTDSAGSVQFDYPSMLVIGPSGGGGGGSTVDPTTIFSTGDIKFRPTSETLSGWVKVNGLTIGSSLSGASGRANADTQALFIYLWTNCDNTHCPVLSGRGANGLADFNANKQLTLPDWRGRQLAGLDDMGSSAGGFFAGVPFTGADTATTPGGFAGENTHTLSVTEIPSHAHTLTDPGHTHNSNVNKDTLAVGGSGTLGSANPNDQGISGQVLSSTTGITMANTGGGGAHNNVSRVTLGSWYIRL